VCGLKAGTGPMNFTATPSAPWFTCLQRLELFNLTPTRRSVFFPWTQGQCPTLGTPA
jgi:hypothetical protein